MLHPCRQRTSRLPLAAAARWRGHRRVTGPARPGTMPVTRTRRPGAETARRVAALLGPGGPEPQAQSQFGGRDSGSRPGPSPSPCSRPGRPAPGRGLARRLRRGGPAAPFPGRAMRARVPSGTENSNSETMCLQVRRDFDAAKGVYALAGPLRVRPRGRPRVNHDSGRQRRGLEKI